MSRRELFAGSGTLFYLAAQESYSATKPQCVIVQAGRRVDAPNAETPRFPPANVKVVSEGIRAKFIANGPATLVTSAACGTDLLCLKIADEMHIERFILLPSTPDTFRASSVADRPGAWGELFDREIQKAHVEVLKLPEGQEGYLETNLRLLDKAQSVAKEKGLEARAMVVWNQQSRGPDDVTAYFFEQARLRHLPIIEISTL